MFGAGAFAWSGVVVVCVAFGFICFVLFLFLFFSFLFFFLFQSGNKRWIKALLSCGAVGWVFWRFIQTVVSIQPDSYVILSFHLILLS